MRDGADDREERLAEREQALADARAALRTERERLAADRAEVDRLLADATRDRRDAATHRGRARKLATRLMRRIMHRQLKDRRALVAEHERFVEQVAHLNAIRSEFHTTATATRDRLAECWDTIEVQQQRVAADWAEADRYIAEQVAALDGHAAELERREKAATDRLAAAESEAAGLREEAAALEQRVQNARAALVELEQRRDRARAELLHIELPVEIAGGANPDDLTHRELLLNRERGAVAALRSSLELESADLNDRRLLVTEQLTQLAEARDLWQRAERQTVVEMEELARSLNHREQALDAREARLVRADVRRREDVHDLSRMRLQLEAWQTKLTVFELRWHTEREELETNLQERLSVLTRREASYSQWQAVLLAERASLAKTASDFEQQHAALVAEVAAHAARALAAEELVTEAMRDAGTNRASRRLAVLRKRWERVFDREVKAAEQRYRELQRLLALPTKLVTEAVAKEILPARVDLVSAASEELVALRAEVERLAASVIEIEFPDLPESAEHEAASVDEPEHAPGSVPLGDARAA